MAGKRREDSTDLSDGTGGDRNAAGFAVAAVIVTIFASFPIVSLAVLYLFLTVYAIVRAAGPGAGEDPAAIVVGFVLVTSTLVVLYGVTIHFVGRSLTPRKRRGGPWV